MTNTKAEEEKDGKDGKAKPKNTKIPQNRKIVIGICTFHRNLSLDGTLESLSRMDLPEEVIVELALVDNDKDGGARELFVHGDVPSIVSAKKLYPSNKKHRLGRYVTSNDKGRPTGFLKTKG